MKRECDFERARSQMVQEQLLARDIRDPRVLAAMGSVPRHRFVPKEFQTKAYDDRPLPLGPEQTISQPYIVALMLQELDLAEGERVLDVGTGSGYQAAVLAELKTEVYSIDIEEKLTKGAKVLLQELGYKSVIIECRDGFNGWREESPFDAIIVAAAPPEIPRELVKQLKPGGRVILPLANGERHELILLTATKEGLACKELGAVRFVPMLTKEKG